MSAAVPLVIAIPLALWAAAAGPRVESVINRVTEGVMAVPIIVIVLTIVGVIGSNLLLVMSIFGVLISAGVYRVFLGQAKSLQSRLYVDAAKTDGSSAAGTSARHVFPGLVNTPGVQFALLFAVGLLVQAGLAFLGFGPPIPAPSWGAMIQTATQHVYDAPWLMVPSGLVLAFTVLSANAVADVLAQSSDVPKLQIVGGRSTRSIRPGNAREPVRSGIELAPSSGLTVAHMSVGLDDGTTLVSDVTIELERGKVLGLVGESGCGKTLTALSLMGLLPGGIRQSAGSVSWGGTATSGLSERELEAVRGHKVAFILQEPMRALDPMFTVEYQLTSTIRRLQRLSARPAREEAIALLSNVGIVDVNRVLRSHPDQISGGMAQRVAIALALAGKSELLVADEPTTALDVTVQAEILSVLRSQTAARAMSMVLVTHDLGVVADICDDVAVMYAGQIVETGTVIAVLEAPQRRYTMALLAADPHATIDSASLDHLAPIPGMVLLPTDWPTGCRFAPRCQFAVTACSAPVALEGRSLGAGEVRCVRCPALCGRSTSRNAGSPRKQGAVVTEAVLEVSDLTVQYERRGRPSAAAHAVDGVSFDIQQGETVGLVGESGSGKTTLGKAILGLQAVTEGAIRFKGADITKATRRVRRDLASDLRAVFQDPFSSLDPRRTVGASLAEPLRIGGVSPSDAERRAVDILDRVRLPAEAIHRYPRQFSGGQRQRISIARALITNPSLVICDEPVSALDLSTQAHILNQLVDLRRDSEVSYLFIAHDIAVVGFLAHRVIVLYRGAVMETGPSEDVTVSPRHPFTRALVAASPVPRPTEQAERRALRAQLTVGSAADATATVVGCPFVARCPLAADVCRTTRPALRAVASSEVACHAWDPTSGHPGHPGD